jgi:hypothetical protein
MKHPTQRDDQLDWSMAVELAYGIADSGPTAHGYELTRADVAFGIWQATGARARDQLERLRLHAQVAGRIEELCP